MRTLAFISPEKRMGLYIRKKLISLFFSRLQHSNSLSLFKTHFSFSSSATAAAENARVNVADGVDYRRHFSTGTGRSELISSKNPETYDSGLSFFKGFGFSTTQIQKLVKSLPRILSPRFDLDVEIKPKLKILEEVGGLSPGEIVEIISINSLTLDRSINVIDSALREFKKLLHGTSSNQGLFRILKKNPRLLSYNLGRTLIPNKELLKNTCGVNDSELARFICCRPQLFLHNHEFVKECVGRVDQMGVPRDSKMFLYATWTLATMSMGTWERKLELFRSLGFSDHDIRSTFRRIPMVFSVSERKIKEVTEVLLSARNDDILLIVNNPGLLIYSVEKRLKPRLRVLEVLETKNLLVKKPKISTACQMTDRVFMMKYVLPYSAEVGTSYPRMILRNNRVLRSLSLLALQYHQVC